MGTYCGDATIVRMDGQVLATVQANLSNQQPGADGQLTCVMTRRRARG
jgi:hypothetical protein